LALKELGGILLEARTLELTELSCQACLATARTLNRKGEFGEAARWVREARLYLSGQPTRKLQAEAEFVDGKICATRAALLNGSKRAEWLESALARFIAALKAGHGSATFEVACREQIAEIQRRLGRLDDARLTISAARSAAREMDGTFLQDRLLKMQREMDEAKHCFFEIGPGFNMDQAALELYTKYILSIASGVGLPPIDLPGNFRLIKGMVAPLSRVRFNRLWSMVKESGAFK
jgi:hypothetical protein